ncbi:catalase [Deinococcus radiophilus]|uniref:catalase n=1 Tax=Deinococcus radiophilus TaxID=32062 RepID=UPI0014737274|nr:catalase [Deinococcus radiophilus]UFA51520.1 catalase [Deinococcus radiophilus]
MSHDKPDAKTAPSNPKVQDLSSDTAPRSEQDRLTDNFGHAISDDNNSLRAGVRGPTLLEDHLVREKLHHFDHERIPERIVHARGAAAHGYFELTDSLAEYTTAQVLTEVGKKTPVFTRFSTVPGSRGSADTPRSIRGFAVRFYTDEGNWDIVGNNVPVFFIQDAIKFPDLVHALRPEPHNEIPQAASAHDTFWDFISLTSEAIHTIMWEMSDRALPRYFDTMQGFGVHTFRLINAEGKSTFVKYHWQPVNGVHSLVWDESQKIAGKDPDFQRRAMWETIDGGGTYEWDFGVQLFTEAQASEWDFDILDPSKIIPEDLVPVRTIGRMVLNRNPDNFFAETEQVGYKPTNLVPGMDFTNDPLMQGRLFSYLDTQLIRLGSPNWQYLPINRPLNQVANNQRDGYMRHTINPGRVAYRPASLDGGSPLEVPRDQGGFVSYPEPVSGEKLRVRAESFADHFGQARLFWNSMTPIEREHICKAFQFELSKVETREVRVRMLDLLEQVHPLLASQVAVALGEAPRAEQVAKPGGTADSAEEMELLATAEAQPSASGGLTKAKNLSMEEQPPKGIRNRQVAILAADGVDTDQVKAIMQALKAEGAKGHVLGQHLGDLGGVEAKKTLGNSHMVLFDAVIVPGGAEHVQALMEDGDAQAYLLEAYKHAKPIAAYGEAQALLADSDLARITGQDLGEMQDLGILSAEQPDLAQFVQTLAQHRFWGRPKVSRISN